MSHAPMHRRGFTFVELCLGLIVMSMVLAGVATFALAVSDAWQAAGSSQSILLTANHDAMLLSEKIRACVLTGGWQTGSLTGATSSPAAILLWKGDANSDGYVNYTEVMLIEYNPTSHQILLYQTPSTYVGTNYQLSYASVFSQASLISYYTPGMTATVLCNNVMGAQFYANSPASATTMPFVEFALNIEVGGVSQIVYGDATLRSAVPVPAN